MHGFRDRAYGVLLGHRVRDESDHDHGKVLACIARTVESSSLDNLIESYDRDSYETKARAF